MKPYLKAANRVPVKDLRTDWNYPTKIKFGVGRVSELPDACESFGIKRPLLVTDPGLVRLRIPSKLIAANQARGIESAVFSKVGSEPGRGSIREGTQAFRSGDFDGIIALGGGSVLDAGKAIALGVAAGVENIWTYTSGAESRRLEKGRFPPIIAVPTTAGTGSEVDASAVISDEEKEVKQSLYHPELMPRVVIADPTFVGKLPGFLTAATGFDALSHNLEALCSPVFNPVLDAIALQGIRYLKDWLPIAFHENRNLRARVYTMAASIMGAIAFEKGLGAMHAMGHAVGARFKTHHGLTVSAIMPYVLKFNRRRIGLKMEQVALFLDLPGRDCRAVVNWVVDLKSQLDLPVTLGDMGVQKSDIAMLAEVALEDVNTLTNPVSLDRRKMETLFDWAIRGKIRL